MLLYLLIIKLAMLPPPFFVAGAASSNQVAAVTYSPTPTTYSCGVDITLSCATTGSHIFYRTDGSTPTHVGDTATGTTIRIGSSSGTFHLGRNRSIDVIAIGYLPSLLDSAPTSGGYDTPCDLPCPPSCN